MSKTTGKTHKEASTSPTARLVDTHSHVLPGLDDGAVDWSAAVRIAEMAAAQGVSTIVATPHQRGSDQGRFNEAIRSHTAQLGQLMIRRGIRLQILPGAEVRIEPDLIDRIRRRHVLSMADRNRHILLELPHEVYLPMERFLRELHSTGLVGILAHPERNEGIIGRTEIVRTLVEAGCLIQVTAASLLGQFGSHVERFAVSLLEQGLVHLIATDAHSVKSRPPCLREAWQRAGDLAGCETADLLCCRNPACVAQGRQVMTPTVRPQLVGWRRWLPWRKTG